MLKRILAVGLLLCSCTMAVAQTSNMTDEQIMTYVLQENEKGTPQSQIVTKLMQQGVTMEQIRRVRDKYQKEKNGDVMGARDITGASKTRDRLRRNNGDKRQARQAEQGTLQRRKGLDTDYSDMTERQRRLMQQKKEEDYQDELDFVLPDSAQMYEDIMYPKKKGKQVFGRDIFNQKKLSFEPNMNIATPQNYRLGPGDVVYVDVWGGSQKSVESTVSPDGTIEIEGFGPVNVSGLTVQQANGRLRSTLGSRYSSSNIKLTVGQTRTIMVNVMGEVVAPGTYTLSAFASVFHALYMAGGTNDLGTLRDIKVYRGGRLVSSVDIYDYILNGKLTGNVRLADNDVIVVGPYDCLVDITGKVKRPMYYEMKKSESIGTLIKYAGGFAGDAYQKNVHVVRKEGGEFSVFTVGEFNRNTFRIADGDSVSVDSMINRYANMVEIKGGVFRPGMYQMDGSIQTVRELIKQAGGVTEEALLTHGVMHRRKADRTLEVIPIDIAGLLNQTVSDIPLKNEDVLFIPSKKDALDEQTFSILGEVVYPGIYVYADNTTLEDLVLQAGGLKDAASVVKVDVSRRVKNNKALKSGNTVAETYSFALKDGFVIDGKQGFLLEPFDEVVVRKSPGYVEQQHVAVEGEVSFPGTYTLSEKNQRLSDIIKAAGGLTDAAYAKGARLERRLTYVEQLKKQSLMKLLDSGDSVNIKKLDLSDNMTVGINLDLAMANPGSDQYDLVIREGDRLIIPQYSNTVTISGEVMYPNTIAFKKGEKLSYYINQAGGYSDHAKKSHTFVVQMNGTVSKVRKASDITPGCEIVTPAKPKHKGMTLAEIIALGTMTASLASVIAVMAKM
jgi:protein involved in polysaccharide export with SLBB domain